jgi:hypothetical protein
MSTYSPLKAFLLPLIFGPDENSLVNDCFVTAFEASDELLTVALEAVVVPVSFTTRIKVASSPRQPVCEGQIKATWQSLTFT